MKKYSTLILTALLCCFATQAVANDGSNDEEQVIITEAPEGEAVEYYADFLNFDNTLGFMGDYHTVQKIIFAEDGNVYFPNLLLRRTMPAYVKGAYDKQAGTITVKAGQPIFYFPNVGITAALYSLDDKGLAGPDGGEFYDQPLVFDVAADGVITLRSSAEYPGFGICNDANSTEVYANGINLRFIPVANIASDDMLAFKSTYILDRETVETTATGYREGDDIIWVKGLDPKYPEAWVKVERQADGYYIHSFQVMMFFASEDPVVAAALLPSLDADIEMPITVNEETLEMIIGDDTHTLANITPDGNGSYEIYQNYTSIHLMPMEVVAATPKAPVFVSYSEPNSSGETEFIFDAYPHDTDNNILVNEQLHFRLYIDEQPYTFTPAQYKWITDEMDKVPYTFSNYNFFSIGGDDKQRRYVYFKDLPDTTKTIGVEMVYVVGDKEYPSERLVYNLEDGSTAIDSVISDNKSEALYYDLRGMKVANPQPGHIYIRIQNGKTDKVLVK